MDSAEAPDRAQNWYSVLGLAPTATAEEIAAAIERLTRQASALALTAPERSRQLRDQARVIRRDLLSGEAERQRYDHELACQSQAAQAGNLAANAPAPGQAYPPAGIVPPGQAPLAPAGPGGRPAQRAASRIARFLQTGWTCPACGHGASPADKFCQKCGSRIQAIASPPAGQAQSAIQPAACANCGESLVPGHAFCARCGTRRA